MNIIAAMLKENTGVAMMDSGGAYGRNWERNRKRNFGAEQPVATRFDIRDGELEIEISLNTYHWLNDKVSFDADMDRKFKRFCKRKENVDNHDLSNMEAFPEYLRSRGHCVSEVCTHNTYNGESALSQVLQFTYFVVDHVPYYLLQIHGGCDVRGGYTGPRAFRDSDESSLFYSYRVSLWAKMDGVFTGPNWESDNAGYSFRPGDYSRDMPLFGTKDYVASPKLESYPVTDDPACFADGKHLFVSDGRAFLPDGSELIGSE